MSTTQKRSSTGCLRRAISLFFGCLLFLCFLFATFVFIESLVTALQYARFPKNGVQTQATVIKVGSYCGKSHSAYTYTLQFTDQAGHAQTGTLLTCESLKLSRGDAMTIVYSPDNPTLIARPNDVGSLPGTGVAAAIVLGLIDLALLVSCIFWVKYEKHIISPLLTRRNHANSHQSRVAE